MPQSPNQDIDIQRNGESLKGLEDLASKEIVKNNVLKMTNLDHGGMLNLILSESCGGNAGHSGDYPCVAANFYYDESGKIISFGNFQDVHPDIIRDNYEGRFRLAFDLGDTWKSTIIDINFSQNTKELTEKRIRDSAEDYNSKYGFKLS